MSKSDKISVSFLGNSAESVTGSMTLIDIPKADKKILLECGGIQEPGTLLNSYKLNNAKWSFKAKDVDYCFIGHCHYDHCANLPLLVKRGFQGKIIIPEGSKGLLKIMLLDSAKISERDADDLSRRYGKNYPPIYTESDVYKTLDMVEEHPIGEKIKLEDSIEFQYIHSGHIVRACQIVFWLKNGSQVRKIGYTSDLGQLSAPQTFVEDFEPIPSCNLLISECTYNDQKRSCSLKDREKDIEKIKSAVYDAIDYKSRILIPSFSLHRTQVLLKVLYDLFYDDEHFTMPIYVGGPLSVKISNAWNELLENEEDRQAWRMITGWSSIQFIDNFDKVEEILNKKDPCIFLMSSGMMTAGFSPAVAAKLLPNGNDHIVFCGYSANQSLSWKIRQKKQKTININGKPVPCRCKVSALVSLSSHMQFEDLISYLSGDLAGKYNCGCEYNQIALHHGEMKGKISFAKKLKERLVERNKTSKVTVVNKSTVIRL